MTFGRRAAKLLAWNRSLEVTLLMGQAAGIVAGIVIARTLGPTGRGVITSLAIWGQFLGWMSAFSLDKAIVVLGAGNHAITDPDSALRTARASVVITGIPLLLIAVLLGPHIVPQMMFVPVFIGVVVATAQGELISGWLLARSRRDWFVVWRLVQPALYLLLTIAIAIVFRAASVERRTLMLGFGLAASLAIPPAIAYFITPKRPVLDFSRVRPFFRFAGATQVGYIFLYLNGRLDVLALSFMAPARDVGYYVVGASVAHVTLLLGTAGVVRAITGEKQNRDLGGILITAVFAGLVIALAPYLVPRVFGESFRPSISIAQILAVTGPVNFALQGVCGRLLAASRPWDVAKAQGIGVGIFAMIILTFPTMHSVAVGSVISYFVSLVAAEILIRRKPSARMRPGTDQ